MLSPDYHSIAVLQLRTQHTARFINNCVIPAGPRACTEQESWERAQPWPASPSEPIVFIPVHGKIILDHLITLNILVSVNILSVQWK